MSITLIIIIITGLISYQCFNDRNLKSKLAHYPVAEANGEYYRLLTGGFVHADTMHLFFNMFVLYNFGTILESMFIGIFDGVLGKIHYTLLYLTAIVAANLTTYAKHKDNPRYSAIGASGAVSAVLFAFIILEPWAPLNFMFIPIDISAIFVAIGFLAWESYAGKKQIGNTDHDGHFYGALFGVLYLIAFKPSKIMEFLQSMMNPPFL